MYSCVHSICLRSCVLVYVYVYVCVCVCVCVFVCVLFLHHSNTKIAYTIHVGTFTKDLSFLPSFRARARVLASVSASLPRLLPVGVDSLPKRRPRPTKLVPGVNCEGQLDAEAEPGEGVSMICAGTTLCPAKLEIEASTGVLERIGVGGSSSSE